MARIARAMKFGYSKLCAVDEMEHAVWKARAVEQVRGSANRVYARSLAALDEASSFATLKKAREEYAAEFKAIPKRSGYEPLVVGMVGEIYVLIEPFSNLELENELGRLGVEVKRHITVSEWIKTNVILGFIGIDGEREIHRAARPYLKRHIDGHGRESIGEKVLHAQDWDGLVHVAPFT